MSSVVTSSVRCSENFMTHFVLDVIRKHLYLRLLHTLCTDLEVNSHFIAETCLQKQACVYGQRKQFFFL